MEFLINKMIRELRDSCFTAEDIFDLIEWIESPEFQEHIKEISEQLDCCISAAKEAAIAGRILSILRPFKKPITAKTYNSIAKLVRDFTSWLLEFKDITNAKLVLAYYFDGLVGDLEKRPGRYTLQHYEIFDEDEDNDLDYDDDDSTLNEADADDQ